MAAIGKTAGIGKLGATVCKGSGGADELSLNIADLNGSYPELFPVRNK